MNCYRPIEVEVALINSKTCSMTELAELARAPSVQDSRTRDSSCVSPAARHADHTLTLQSRNGRGKRLALFGAEAEYALRTITP